MKLTSTAFEHEGTIPSKYTCDGENISPPLTISDIPEGTQALALIMDDPDAPAGTWDHWIIWNIPPDTANIESQPQGTRGKNSWEKLDYDGPCPPNGEHRYYFKLFALDSVLDLPEGSQKSALLDSMQGHILAETTLMGKYERITTP